MIIIKVEVNVGLPLTEDEETNTLNNMKVEWQTFWIEVVEEVKMEIDEKGLEVAKK
jgi:hypothetical protein